MSEEKHEQATSPSHFDRAHAARLQNRVLQRVWQLGYGDDYPAEVKPSAFYSRWTLRRLAQSLAPAKGQTLVDLGCGHGGTSLWVAKQFGLKVVGVDLSPGGVALATAQAVEMGMTDDAKFKVGDVTATGLADASCDAAISLDVIIYVPDKEAAMKEVARIIRPGGRFGFTVWEQSGYSQRLKAQQFLDYRPLMAAADFDVEIYEEPPNWRQQQQRTLELLVENETAEMDPADVGQILAMARGSLNELSSRRYVLAVGRRRYTGGITSRSLRRLVRLM
jgi:ubiquinone/menaquinone biosynthesis C-methylase UbiE